MSIGTTASYDEGKECMDCTGDISEAQERGDQELYLMSCVIVKKESGAIYSRMRFGCMRPGTVAKRWPCCW